MNESKDDQQTNEPFRQDTQNDNILTLPNDDCLRQIFGKFYRLNDFHSIAKVCMQFNRIAKEVFASKIKHKSVNFKDLMDKDEGEITLSEIEIFLSNFGSSIFSTAITKMSCSFENIPNASDILLNLIHKHCKNLRKLTVTVNITKETLYDIRPILSQLKYLQINLWPALDIGSFNDCLVYCTQLETLCINGCNHLTH